MAEFTKTLHFQNIVHYPIAPRERPGSASPRSGIKGSLPPLGWPRVPPLLPLPHHSYRVREEVSRVGVDGELVVLRHDGVGDLPVRPGAVLGVPVDGAHLSHPRP